MQGFTCKNRLLILHPLFSKFTQEETQHSSSECFNRLFRSFFYKALTHHFVQLPVTGQSGSKNNMSLAEHAWPHQLQQPCFQGCHLKTSGHMKNAGSISDINRATKRPKQQEAEDTLLNKTGFITEVLDAIKLFTT